MEKKLGLMEKSFVVVLMEFLVAVFSFSRACGGGGGVSVLFPRATFSLFG